MKASYREALHIASANSLVGSMVIAVMIARAFGGRCPTSVQLQEKYNMSRACAYRWVRAWKEAHGVLE